MNAANPHSLQRLALLQGLAAQQEHQAARLLAEALARHANAEDRRTELLHYEQEYAERGPLADDTAAASGPALSRHAGFLAKLRDAVRFQTERAEALVAEVELARSRWIAVHREVETLEQLAANTRTELRHAESRRDARELDELATGSWLRQRAVG